MITSCDLANIISYFFVTYYDSIIDQKKVFSEIEENSKCKIIQ